MAKTRYVVFEEVQEGSWRVYSPIVEATSSIGAIRAALKESGDAGSYVAVPLRSWKAYSVRVETQHLLKIG